MTASCHIDDPSSSATSGMPVVLVVRGDDVDDSVEAELRAGYDAVEARSVAEALHVLDHRADVWALVLDLGPTHETAHEAVAALEEYAQPLPTVALCGALSPTTYDRLREVGALRILERSQATARDIREAIDLAAECATGVRGSIHGLSLVDLLQMYFYARRSIWIEVRGEASGSVVMQYGEIVHAETGSLVGVDALKALLAQPQATVKTHACPEAMASTIAVPFESLLLDCLRLVDEESYEAVEPCLESSIFEASAKATPDDELRTAFGDTIVRRCPSASVIRLAPNLELDEIATPEGRGLVDCPVDDLATALEPARMAGDDGQWAWMLRLSSTLVAGCVPDAHGGISLCTTPRLGPSTEGRLLVGLRAASDRLRGPSEGVTLNASAATHALVPSSREVRSAGRKLLAALNETGSSYRVFMPGDDHWLLGDDPATLEKAPLEVSMLAVDLLRGTLGSALRQHGAMRHGLPSESPSSDPALTSVLATSDHLVFARPLDASGATLVLVTDLRLAGIGSITNFLRRHPSVRALDSVLAQHSFGHG